MKGRNWKWRSVTCIEGELGGIAKATTLVFINHLKHISAQYIETSYHLSLADPLHITAHNLIVSPAFNAT
jgi:hypothetical protein